jgi:Permuted papain-like amidase enzyme, YaeF/YiiX, C92 family
MNRVAKSIGKWLAIYLSKEIEIKATAPPSNPLHLQATLRPGDILLVEGNTRLSGAIKYLTQSTWSHAALYVGMNFNSVAPEDHCLVEADTVHGVRSTSLEKFVNLHTRICRPIGLSEHECAIVTQSAIDKIGDQYDLRNVFDLARYLFPTPPVPTRFRRQLLSLGSGDPTRAICSTLIAQAFESIHYPIAPLKPNISSLSTNEDGFMPEVFNPKHFSLLTPRDFDVSPYFAIIKPTVECGFDFHNLEWGK